tara:strand:+ start:666 stop:839 length:174 start_codon:yes stop_codon:yes gene_type:complete
MAKIHLQSCTNKGKGFSFSLLPILTFDKTEWINRNEFDLMIGIWFWYIEINWEQTND